MTQPPGPHRPTAPSSQDALPGFRRGIDTLESIKRKAQAREGLGERIADFFTLFSGSMAFVYIHAVWFLGWIAWNLKWIPGLAPFDPFPFGLLTMIVSLEAIFLSTFVLISQNRDQRLAAVRDEVQTEMALYQEQELTLVLRMVHQICKHHHIEEKDERLVRAMEHFVNADNLFGQIEQQVDRHKS